MANPNPPKHTRFKPGVSGNPSGKPKGLLTVDQVSAMMGRFCHLTRDELHKVVSDPKSTMLEVTVASILAKAAKDGDYSRLEFLLQRSVGKVKDVSETTIKNDLVEKIPTSDLLSLVQKKA